MSRSGGGGANGGGRSAEDWLAAFAKALGAEPPDDDTVELLLDLAGVAAHGSERMAAPIACYIAGRMGIDPAQALAVARDV